MFQTVSRTAFAVAVLVGCCCSAFADETPGKPQRIKPPKLVLRAAAPANLGGSNLLSLTLEISNPNAASLVYTGYTPDSFDPPLTAGRISPLCQIELKQAGHWRRHPIGYCGTGMADLELAPGSSATFGVMVPADDWQAVKIAIGSSSGSSAEGIATALMWSIELSLQAVGAREGAPAPAAPPPAAKPPLGKWRVEFANGVTETCEIREDGTATVEEPRRRSAGRTEQKGDYIALVFDDDRLEHWTAVGERFVVEHWFPGSRVSAAAPALGIAERGP
ncbi:MAG TPA: hypothetical protein VGN42_19870 [Pirellulales bacterium]|nr:hypothetical protein [Pirellulales bacterium]